MNCIREMMTEPKLRVSAFRNTLLGATLLVMLTLLAAMPSHADYWYSGAAVLSNGTVYGWGVTDVTNDFMFHMAWATTTLTSPVKHRQAYNTTGAQNVAVAEVTLPFDGGDLGYYEVQSIHSAYCFYCYCFYVDNAMSWASTNLAQIPYKLSLVSTLSQGPSSCDPGQAGWDRKVLWQVMDQFVPAHPIQRAMGVSDSIAIGSPNTCGVSPKVGSGGTDGFGRFDDHYWLCSTGCVGGTCQTNASQTWTVDGTVLTSDVKSIVYRCNSITINGQ